MSVVALDVGAIRVTRVGYADVEVPPETVGLTAEAVAFVSSVDQPKIMDLVRSFCFEHNLLGEKVKSKDVIGIQTPRTTLGSAKNVKLRFDPTYMKLAADGKL